VNSDELVYSLWSRYTKPLIYTPGDNEWTDCNKTGEGGDTGHDGGTPFTFVRNDVADTLP